MAESAVPEESRRTPRLKCINLMAETGFNPLPLTSIDLSLLTV